MTKTFGKNLKKYMDMLNLSQSDLANKSGLTRAAVSRIINDDRDPQLKSVIKILSVIPIKFEQLIDGVTYDR